MKEKEKRGQKGKEGQKAFLQLRVVVKECTGRVHKELVVKYQFRGGLLVFFD